MSKYEVVISGISGRFPECDDIRTFKAKLYKGDNFITVDNRKWPVGYKYKFMPIPSAMGKYTDIEKFDRTIFKMNRLFALSSDIMNRKILEPTFEAIVDAGVNPYLLDGENIGVFTSCGINDMDNKACKDDPNVLAMIGSSKTMLSNRISFAFNFIGPSFNSFTDILGGLDALALGYKYVSEGFVDAAVVGVSSSIMDPKVSLPFTQLSFLSFDALTRVFDEGANGYVRSESTIVFYIQRKENAKRNYGTLKFCDTFFLGLNPHTLLAYDKDFLKISLQNIYKNHKQRPELTQISYIEMNANAVKKLEIIESNVVAELFTKNRTEPLLVGSVKSNVGHSEGASGLMSVLKVLFALDTGYIAPNLHLKNLNENIVPLKEKKLKVVQEITKLSGDVVAVNSFGLCGTVGHAVIQKNPRGPKIPNAQKCPRRLLLICGRVEDDLRKKIIDIEEMPFNEDFVALANEVFIPYMPLHVYRGYSVLPKPFRAIHAVEEREDKNRPVWFVFSGMGSQWNRMGQGLLDFPIFVEVVNKCHKILQPKGINVREILLSDDPRIFDNIINAFVGIITVQIGLVEILKALEIKPNGIIGHSVGENACAYAAGCLTLEQTVLSSYARGVASTEVETIKGMMAAIGKGYDQIKNALPKNIEVACHNSSDNCTLTGPANDVNNFVQKLQIEGVFAKTVNVANIAYHSKYIAPAAPKLLSRLNEVIKKPKERPSIWISTSIPESRWNTNLARYCSAEYLTNNLLSSVLFEEGCKHIPQNAIVVEIAPHGLLQAILKRSLHNNCTNISLTYRSKTKENTNFLLSAIGRLYIAGLEPKVNNLYPPTEYPVPCGTPSISPYCTWYYSSQYSYAQYLQLKPEDGLSSEILSISIKDDAEYRYLRYHKINDEIVMPPSLFVYLTWWMLSIQRNQKLGTFPVLFENVKIRRHLSISINVSRSVSIMIQPGTGNFEVLLEDEKDEDTAEVVLSGLVTVPRDNQNTALNLQQSNTLKYTVAKDQFYHILRNVGYQLSDCFAPLNSLLFNETDSLAKLTWSGNWVAFIDSLMKYQMFWDMKLKSDLLYPTFFRKMLICSAEFMSIKSGAVVSCHIDLKTKMLRCNGLEMCGLQYKTLQPHFMNKNSENILIEGLRFVSHKNPQCQNVGEFFNLCLQIAIEHVFTMKLATAKLHIIDITDTYKNIIVEILKYNSFLQSKIIFHNSKNKLPEKLIKGNDYVFLVTNNLTNVKSTGSHSYILAVLLSLEFITSKLPTSFVLVSKERFSGYFYCLLKKIDKNHLPLDVLMHYEKKLPHRLSQINDVSKPAILVRKTIESEDLSLIFSPHKKHTNIRYLYLLDEKVEFQELNKNLMEEQIMQDLPVAILKNGQWGSYKNISIQTKPNLFSLQKSRTTKSSNIRFESVEDDSLRLNYGNSRENDSNEKVGVQYSAVHTSKGKIMGIAYIDTSKATVEVKEELTWNIPEYWNLEEASSTPFAYVQAYNILVLSRGSSPTHSVLINYEKENSVANACIAVSLYKNYSVFVTVSNEDETTHIKKMFPDLEDYRILGKENYRYETELTFLRRGKGVDIVVNFFKGLQHVTSSLNCVSSFGLYVEIGEKNCLDDYNIGLYPFLKSVSFVKLQNRISAILKLSIEDQQNLKNFLEDGIKSGFVKPFSEKLRQNERENELEDKQEQWESRKNNARKIRYDHNRSYMIIAGRQRDNIWLDLVEWLIVKGARKLTIALENFIIGSKISHQLNRLINQTKATIVLTSSQKTDSLSNTIQLVADADKIAPLEAIFVMCAKAAGNKISNLDAALSHLQNPKIHIVNLFSGGLKECESRFQKGNPVLAIYSENNKNLSFIFEQIGELTARSYDSPVLFNVKDCHSNPDTKPTLFALREYLPQDLKMLEDFGGRINGTMKFEEITSLSLKYSDSKGIYPVFVIPSIHYLSLESVLRKLLYPVFSATLTNAHSSVPEVASELFNSLSKIQSFGPVTLISETWSACIAFELSTLLEKNGRQHKVFLLDGNPLDWKDRITNLCFEPKTFELSIVKQILRVDSTPSDSEINLKENIEEILNKYLTKSTSYKGDLKLLTKSVTAISNRLKMAADFKITNRILNHFTIFERHFLGTFPNKLSVTSNLIVVEAENYQDFLRNYNIARIINETAAYSWWCCSNERETM